MNATRGAPPVTANDQGRMGGGGSRFSSPDDTPTAAGGQVDADLLRAALDYAARGWKVFPLAPHAKLPLIPAARGGHGVLDATADPEQVRAWWTAHPDANIGLAAGASGLVFVDVDAKNGGYQSWATLKDQLGFSDSTPTFLTGGGGLHLVYAMPPDVALHNTAGKLGPGLDTRANGGYVVAPPSIHPNGLRYHVDPTWNLDHPILPLPAELVKLLMQPDRPADRVTIAKTPGRGYGAAALRAELDTLGRAIEGERNDRLNRAAFALGQLVAGGELERGDVEQQLLDVALTIGLTERESSATIHSGIEAGLLDPRSAPDPTSRPATIASFTPTPEPPAWLNDDGLAVMVNTAPTKTAPKPPELALLSARDLLTREWPIPLWIVPELLPVGLAFLAGRPKIGKSWLALQLVQAVATGGDFLKRHVDRGRCLYLALEDPPRRLAERMRAQGWTDYEAQADFATVGSLRAGGGDVLAEVIRKQGYKLVVIDTLSRALSGDQNDAQAMTTALIPLQEAAHAVGCCVLLVDHHNKIGAATSGAEDDGGLEADPIVNLAGTIAKGGVADVIFGMYRLKGKRGAVLAVTGRDVEEQSLRIVQDATTHIWQPEDLNLKPQLSRGRADILDAIKNLGGEASYTEVTKTVQMERSNVYHVLQDLVNLGYLVFTNRRYAVICEN